jgi:hypothetical protein
LPAGSAVFRAAISGFFSYQVILTLTPGLAFSRLRAASSRNATLALSSASCVQTSSVTSWALLAVVSPIKSAAATTVDSARLSWNPLRIGVLRKYKSDTASLSRPRLNDKLKLLELID